MSSLSTSASELPDAATETGTQRTDNVQREQRQQTVAQQLGGTPAAITIAYLINQYPQASQSFVRREIVAMESQGIRVQRFTLRKSDNAVDAADVEEAKKTRAVLSSGILTLLGSLLLAAMTRPVAFFKALRIAIKAGRRNPRGIAVHLVYLVEACVLLRWFAEAKIGHVHAHFGTNSTTVAMLCGILGGPTYSFTAHGPEEFDSPGALWLSEKIARAKFVVAISEFGRSQLYRWCDLQHWRKIHVVRCGLDEMFLKAHETPIPREKRLVCVGRLAEQKGQLLLVQAADILAKHGIEFELVFVGDGPMRPDIEGVVREWGLESRVKITGWATNAQVREHIQSARAMVLPSFAEGLPVVMMEALALRRPVIGTTIAGVPELVKPGVSGWLVPAGDLEALVQAMREALEAPMELLERMGAAGARAVGERHCIGSECQKLAALFAAGPIRAFRRGPAPHGHEESKPFKDEGQQEEAAPTQVTLPGQAAWVQGEQPQAPALRPVTK